MKPARLYFAVCVFCILLGTLMAQNDRTFQALDDMETELETNELTLRFLDAITGETLPAATIGIENIGIFKTDTEGKIRFPIPSDGKYRIIFKKERFIKSVFPIEIVANTLIFNQFSISPSLPVGSIRVVLDWGQSPRDLDAHFIKKGNYHISYRNKRVSDDGISMLDRDDVDGYGPETITSKEIDNTVEYIYFVHDYTNQNKESSLELSRSRAHVKVFGNNQLLHAMGITSNKAGTYWEVFKIVNGEVVLIDQLKNSVNN